VPPTAAVALLGALRAEGLDDDEVLAALPRLPVDGPTADRVRHLVETEG
jgi:hypothetical protein